MKLLILILLIFIYQNLLANETQDNKKGAVSAKMMSHIYTEDLAKSIFAEETKINDFLDVSCTPDNKLKVWNCYISQYVKFYDGEKYTKVDENSNKWHLIIDFINQKYLITQE